MQENSKKSIHRLQEYITTKGISLNKLSLELGLSNSYFSKMVRNSGSIGSDIIEKIIRLYPDLNADWLLTGNGCMIKNVPSQNFSEQDLECPPFLSPSCRGQKKETDEDINELNYPDDLKIHIDQIKNKRVNHWISEDYISDNDKSAISFMWDIFDKNIVRTLYQSSIHILNNKIAILKRDLMDLYEDDYSLIEAINRFKLGSYSSKFEMPPTSSERMKILNEEFENEFSKIEDKKLKAAFWVLELEQAINDMHDSIHLTITLFRHASHFISIYHQTKLTGENNDQNKS